MGLLSVLADPTAIQGKSEPKVHQDQDYDPEEFGDP